MPITLSNPKVQEDYTSQLRALKKFRARSTGSLGSAIESAAYYARKFQRDFFCYPGSSYGHFVWHVSYKPSEYLNGINNAASTGDSVLSVSPDMTVTVHEVTRERKTS